jgi:hypothetical protein
MAVGGAMLLPFVQVPCNMGDVRGVGAFAASCTAAAPCYSGYDNNNGDGNGYSG